MSKSIADLTLIEQTVLSLDMSKVSGPPVYKFVKEEYMENFFNSGDIKLGSLHDFRKTEKYGLNRGDPTEGKNTVVQNVEYHRGPTTGTFKAEIMNFDCDVTIKNATLIQRREWPDSYVFCTSRVFSEELFLKWNAKEGMTACYEIFNTMGFALEIGKVLKDRAYFTGLDYIEYIDGDIDGESTDFMILAPFIKQLPYSWQDEFRWVWTHRHPAIDLKGANFFVPKARQYCRKVARLAGGQIEYLWHEELAKA